MPAAVLRQPLNHIARVSWVLFLVALPLTNFPLFPPAIGGEALVRPLSLYPLLILIPLVIIPQAFKRTLPKTLLPLLAFSLVAVASSLLSLLRGIDPALGVSVTERIFRGMLTLGFGCAVYLIVALIPTSLEDLHSALRWIYLGAVLALLWGTLQAIYILHFNQNWFNLLDHLQTYISNRHLFTDRISGMTYEPNWFAEQIVMLWFPWLMASVLRNYSVFQRRWRWLSFEMVLLAWSILLLPFTFSRAGGMNLIILGFLSILLFRPRKGEGSHEPPSTKSNLKWIRDGLLIVLMVSIIIILIILVGTKNPFFARIWDYWRQENPTLRDYLSYLGFDARLIYSQAAVNIYQQYPLLGVGLGNYAFYFADNLPYRSVAHVPEILKVLQLESSKVRLITAKNFFLRLMAETGMVGTVVFLSFAIAILGSAIHLWLSPYHEFRYWGSAGLIGLIAFTLSTLTFDSFVIPNMWVLFGLITASTRVNRSFDPGPKAW